jgi:lantibiotic modifying enzyme
LNGENVPLLDYVDQITTGFTKMYRFLGAQRQALLAPNGILARFAEDKARLIFRPSMNYEIIMRQVANPNVLRSSIVFDWLLDYLWLPINARPGLWKVIKAEREAMENLMVPLFHACPGKHSVWSGEQEFSAVLPRTGLQTATAFIEEINEVSLARQIWFIRASMAAPAIKDTPPLSPLRLSDLPSQTVWPPEKLLAEIEEIVNRLESLAWTNRQGVTWFGLKPMIPAMKDADKVREALQTGAPWSLTPMDMDLYRGLL